MARTARQQQRQQGNATVGPTNSGKRRPEQVPYLLFVAAPFSLLLLFGGVYYFMVDRNLVWLIVGWLGGAFLFFAQYGYIMEWKRYKTAVRPVWAQLCAGMSAIMTGLCGTHYFVDGQQFYPEGCVACISLFASLYFALFSIPVGATKRA